MSRLSNFELLSFDVYGTLIDRDQGIMNALQPTLTKNDKCDVDPKEILRTLNALEASQQKESPTMIYSKILATVFPRLCESLG